MKKKSLLLFTVSVVCVALAFFFQKKLSEFSSLGMLSIFLINLFGSATLFFPAPALASVVAGGIIYPPFLVALLSALGSAIGDMVGFFLGSSGKHFIFAEKHRFIYSALTVVFKKYGGAVIFFFALIPNPLFDAIGILAGIFSYSPIRFFLLLFVGRLVRDIILAYVGAQIFHQ